MLLGTEESRSYPSPASAGSGQRRYERQRHTARSGPCQEKTGLNDSRLFGFFDHGFGTDYHYYAVFGYRVTGAVGFGVVADYCAFGQTDVAINYGAAYAAAAADDHVIEDDALIHFAVAIDAHVETEHGFGDASAGNDGAGADDGIQCDAHARGIGKDKFRGRILLLPCMQRPAFIVEIEDRGDGNQVHVGFVVGLDGADITPV